MFVKILEAQHRGGTLVLVLGGLHGKYAVLCGIWVKTKQLLKELDKSWKILMEFADRRTFQMNKL